MSEHVWVVFDDGGNLRHVAETEESASNFVSGFGSGDIREYVSAFKLDAVAKWLKSIEDDGHIDEGWDYDCRRLSELRAIVEMQEPPQQ